MSDPDRARRDEGAEGSHAASPYGGLCAKCRHRRVIRSERGSVFVLCQRAKDDPRFPRYPPQPVARCSGFESES